MLGGIAKPSLSRAADRPVITHGIQSGDVSVNSGVVWARADRPARMLVEVATTDSFKTIRSARLRRCAAGDRFHRQGADRRPAGRPGHLLSHPLPGPCRRRPSSASRRSGAFAPRRATGARSRSSGRATPRAGLGHRRGARRHAHLRDHARQPAGLLHPFRRPHLRRLSDRARSCKLPNGEIWTQPRHRGEVQGRRRRSPTFAATTNTTCSTATCARSMPRSRCSRNGTITRSPTTGARASRSAARLRRQEHAAARGARPPRLPRVHADAPDAGGGRARSIARSRTARCSTCSCSTCARYRSADRRATAPRRRRSSGRRSSPGSSAN